jgi:hypothetical protein
VCCTPNLNEHYQERPNKMGIIDLWKHLLKDLQFDINRWKWNHDTHLLDCSFKNGC